MLCKNCGKDVKDDSQFCWNCGTNIEIEKSNPVIEESPKKMKCKNCGYEIYDKIAVLIVEHV